MARSTRTRDFRRVEDRLIDAIDFKASRAKHFFPSAFTEPTFSQGCRGFRLFEVARISVFRSSVQQFTHLFENWISMPCR